MWIFDPNAFTSTVAYNPTKDRAKVSKHREVAEASEDPTSWLLVRARIGADLEFMETLVGEDLHIYEDIYADYSWRALISRENFKKYLAAQVDSIDYGAHFKEVVKARSDQKTSTRRYSAMMGVWTAMAALQETIPYTGRSRLAPLYSTNKKITPSTSMFSDGSYVGATSSVRDGGLGGASYYMPQAEFDLGAYDEAEDFGTIGITEMGELAAVRGVQHWTEDEVERLDLEALDVYLSLLEDRMGKDPISQADFAAYVQDMGVFVPSGYPDRDNPGLVDTGTSGAVADDDDWVEVSDVADLAVEALEKSGWFSSVTEISADESVSVTRAVLDGADVFVTIEMVELEEGAI